MASSTSQADALSKDFDFEDWRKFSRDRTIERRKSAAMNIVPALYLLDDFTDEILDYFQIVEDLLFDLPPVQVIILEKVKYLFAELSKVSILFEQANMRLPTFILYPLSIPATNAVTEAQSIAISTVQKLLKDNMLKLDVVVNIVIPTMFEFIQISMDELKTLQTTVHDSMTSNAEYWAKLIAVLQILKDVVEGCYSYPKEWIAEHVVPPFTSIITSQSPLLRKEIREFFASSLALLAHSSGQQLGELVSTFRILMHDVSVDVHYPLLRGLSDFFKVISPTIRLLLASELKNLMPVDNDAKSWRLRAVFADQLTLILPLFENAQIDTFFTPFALTFCADRIAVVRIAGISLLSNILALFINTEWNDFKAQNEADETMEPLEPPTCRPLSTSLLKEIRAGFLNTRCWRRRQSFGRLLYMLLQNLLIDEERFRLIFNSDLIRISNDNIVNIRQYFCLLAKHIRLGMNPGTTDLIKSRLVEISTTDADLEVRHQALMALGEIDTESEIDLQGRKDRLELATEAVCKASSNSKKPDN